MKTSQKIFELAKENSILKYSFDKDIQNGEDLLKLNTTRDILYFINFITETLNISVRDVAKQNR